MVTPKPSLTNCPKLALGAYSFSRKAFCEIVSLLNIVNPILGGYSVGVPPLPIPNREVKPVRADGTAIAGE